MIAPRRHLSRRIVALALFALVLGALAGGAAVPDARAAEVACWKRLLSDWYDGRIDNAYPVRCYRQAIANLPDDIKAYTEAREDIQRALLAALRSTKKPPDSNFTVQPERPAAAPKRSGGRPAQTRRGREAAAPRSDRGAIGRDEESSGLFDTVFTKIAPGNADSVPLPLIVLAALALLLLAAAGAGLATRRLQTRRAPPGTLPGEPPG